MNLLKMYESLLEMHIKCLKAPALLLLGLRFMLMIAPFKAEHNPPLNTIVTTQDILGRDVFFEIIDPADLQYTYRMRPAKDFGSTFKQRWEHIPLVLASPSHACQKLKNRREMRDHVALIERGECSFVTKAYNAEAAGAVAVIITQFNNESAEFDFFIEMVNDNSEREVNIPAGYLLGKTGLTIRNSLWRHKRSHAIINLPVNLTFVPPSRINLPPWSHF